MPELTSIKRGEFTAIKIASAIHLCWGALLFLAPQITPRPFGSLEPYFAFMSVRETGAMLLSIGFLAVLSNELRLSKSWLTPLLTIPQQLVLWFGCVAGISTAFTETAPARTAFSLVYVLAISYFHTKDVFHYWMIALGKRKA